MATLSLKRHSPRVPRLHMEQAPPAIQTVIERLKQAEKQERTHLVRVWLQTFPVFERAVPLQIGIRQILLAQRPVGISRRTLNRALRNWTSQAQYQQALASGGKRYGLYGEHAGAVTPLQQAKAARKLETQKHASTARLAEYRQRQDACMANR
jgi:ProP effector